MESELMQLERKLLTRNKWAYSVGGIGRDMIYQLVATFFITYVQFSGLGLSKEQFGVIGILLVIGRVWDAINDPIMGSIVENTKSRFGKFKPWILIGAILTAIVIVFMFNFRPTGWGFVIFFGVIYLLWEMAYTLNDIPYWSLLPNLSTEKKERDSIATMVVVFAGVGAFLANAIISFTTVGNAVKGYSMISITFAIFFLACTFLTVFGVKEPNQIKMDEEKVSIKKMFQVIFKNDQLLWSTLSLIFYSIGSGLLVALGYNFFYIELGYDAFMVLIFVATFGVSNILVQSFYAKLAKRFSRRKLMKYAYFTLAFGYVMLLTLGYLPILPVNLVMVCLFGAFVFSGQAIFYMILIVNMTNTIEYNEFKTNQRNEAVVFSVRPFAAKLSSALQQGVVTLVLIISGVYMLSQNVSQLEAQKNIFDQLSVSEQTTYQQNVVNRSVIFDGTELEVDEIEALYDAMQVVTYQPMKNSDRLEMVINQAANTVFRDRANPMMKLALRLSITILPAILILVSFLILEKKFIIQEKYYETITQEIINRKEKILKSME